MKKVKVSVSNLPCVATTRECYANIENGGTDSSSDIKALEEKVNTNTTNITALKNEKQDKTDTTLATNAKTVVGAINEVNTTAEVLNATLVEVKDSLNAKQDIVDNTLATTAKTVPDAINELNTKIDGLGTLVDFKGTVENYADLPTEGMSANDYYFVKNDTTDESGAVTYKKGFYMYCGTHSTWEFITVGVSGDSFVNLTDPQTISGQKTFTTTPTTTEQGNLITTSALDLKLKNYVDTSTVQTIKGRKTFEDDIETPQLDVTHCLTVTNDAFFKGENAVRFASTPQVTIDSTNYNVLTAKDAENYVDTTSVQEIDGGKTFKQQATCNGGLSINKAEGSTTSLAVNSGQSYFNEKVLFNTTPTVKVDSDYKEVLVKNTLTSAEIEEKIDEKQPKAIDLSASGITATTVEGALVELKSAPSSFLKGTVNDYSKLPTEGDYEVGIAFVASNNTTVDGTVYPKGIYYLADNTEGAFVWKHITSASLNFKGVQNYSALPTVATEGDVYFCAANDYDTSVGITPIGLYVYYGGAWHGTKDLNAFVTIDKDQTINGTKTFNTTPKDSKGNLLNQDDLTTINDTKQNKAISIEGITATTVEGALAELKTSGGGNYKGKVQTYGDLPTTASEGDMYYVQIGSDYNNARYADGLYIRIGNYWCDILGEVVSTVADNTIAGNKCFMKVPTVAIDDGEYNVLTEKEANIQGTLTVDGVATMKGATSFTDVVTLNSTTTVKGDAFFESTPLVKVGDENKEVLVKSTKTAAEIETAIDEKQNKKISISGITATTVEGALAEVNKTYYVHNIYIGASHNTAGTYMNFSFQIFNTSSTALTSYDDINNWLKNNGFKWSSASINTLYPVNGTYYNSGYQTCLAISYYSDGVMDVVTNLASGAFLQFWKQYYTITVKDTVLKIS